MRLEIDIKRAEQSFDFESQETGYFLVVEVFGAELRVPCTEEQLTCIISNAQADTADVAAPFSEERAEKRAAPSTFVGGGSAAESVSNMEVVPSAPRAQRELRPISRTTEAISDDAGIAQG